MALAFTNSGTEVVNCGTGSSHHDLSTLTLAAWVYPTTVAAGTTSLLAKGGIGTGNRMVWRMNSAGAGQLYFHRLRATTATVYIANSSFLTVDTWQFLAVTFDTGASAGEIVNIYRGTLSSLLTEATYLSTQDGSGALTTDTGDNLLLGNLGQQDDAWPGSIAWVGIWNRALTLAELQQQQYRPRRTSGSILFTHLGLVGTGTQPDWSGSGNTGTVTGATVANHVPLPNLFAMGGDDVPYAVVGGTAYNQSASGTLTTAGATIKATSKSPAGTLTSAGDLVKSTAKALVGTLTSSGALSALRTAVLSLGGTLTSAGDLIRSTGKTVAGTLTSAGTLSKAVAKLLDGTLTSAGTLVKETAKLLGGVLSLAGTLTSSLNGGAQQYFQDVGGTLTSAGALVKSTAKSLAGTITSAGDTVKSTAKALVGTLTSSGGLSALRTAVLSLAGTLTSSGALVRSTGKTVAGTLTTSGVISKAVSKALAGALTFIGTLLSVLAGSVTPHIDVTLTDAAVYTVTLTNSAVSTITLSDAAVYAVTLSDASRS